MDEELRRRRLETLEVHFQSEVDHDWDACVGTFAGHPRYEIVPTGQIHDGEEAVRSYHRNQRIAFPDQHTRTYASTCPTTTRSSPSST